MKKFLKSCFSIIAIFTLMTTSAHAAGFVSNNKVASFSNTNFGVLNMDPTNGGVDVTVNGLTGDAWGDVVGWIRFAGTTGNTQHAVDVSCSAGVGTLSGYAWGQNAGWVNFGPFNNNAADQVTIDGDGYFDGAAWSQNYGWIQFDSSVCTGNAGPGNDLDPVGVDGDGFSGGCVQTNFSCPTGGGGGGSAPWCSLVANPSQITQPGAPVALTLTMNSVTPATASFNGQVYNSSVTVTVNPQATATYTATISNAYGTSMCNETIVVSPNLETLGCVDPAALNFNQLATVDNGSCVYTPSFYPLEYTGDIPAPSSSQCDYFDTYLSKGDRGVEVAKVQRFLNTYNNEQLRVDGIYGTETTAAVHRFQTRHFDDIIKPWSPPLPLKTTGRWYKTTMGTANIIVGCSAEDVYLEFPQVVHSFTQTLDRLYRAYYNLVQSIVQ